MSRRVLLRIAVAALAAAPIVALAQTPPATGWQELTSRLGQAALRDDVTTLKAVRVALLGMLTDSAAPKPAPLIRYAIAYAGYCMSFNPSVSAREQSGFLDEAVAHLQAALKADPGFAEAFGLLSSVYGIKIAHSPISGIVLGPRAGAALESGLRLEPENPRLLLSLGISRFNTPAMFGGSDKQAEALLRQALAAFSREPLDKPWPNWGRFDAHVWLGQVLAKRHDKTGARAEYTEALKIAPESKWVKYVLLPAVDR